MGSRRQSRTRSQPLIEARKTLFGECRTRGWQPLTRAALLSTYSTEDLELHAGLRAAHQTAQLGWHAGLAVTKTGPRSELDRDALAIFALAQNFDWALAGFEAAPLNEDVPAYEAWLTLVPLPPAEERPRPSGRPQELDDEVVQEIWFASESGATPYAIAKDLNERGVPPARGGQRWYPSTVTRVLHSRAALRIKAEAESGPAEEGRDELT